MKPGDKVIILDPWRRNPVPVKVAGITDTGGVYGDDERGVRHFTPDADRVVVPDLFSPLMPWERT